MSITRVATRYAKSLLDLAVSESKLDRVVADMDVLNAALESRELQLLLKSPIIKSEKKASVFTTLFGEKLSDLTMSFLTQTLKKGRENVLPDIIKEFSNQHRELNHVTLVKLTTAVPTDEHLIGQIKNKLENSGVATESIEIESVIDPTIIGGYILEFGDKLFNASITYQLGKLKKSFAN